ncbi:hybrid sensor histidine kinase/response regulator [Octadecabacter ascidiaceicola]|nr:PAS-domain containing protein [Octadecabacter ascidiaceicola]
MNRQNTQLVGMIRSGLNLITQAISIHDQDLKLVHANRPFQTMFQIPDALMQIGTDFHDTLQYVTRQGEYGLVDDVDAFVEDKIALARQFKPHYFERTRANGTSISIDGSPLEEGGWITVYTDITEIKRKDDRIRSRAQSLSDELLERSATLAETNRELTATVRALEVAKQDLQASRERLDLINRMTPAHIAHVDAGGFYTHSNGRLPRILPDTDFDIIGEHMGHILGEQIWAHVAPRLERVLKGEEDVTEFRDEHSGTYVRLAMSPDFSAPDVVDGAYILSTDVTEEVTARNALTYARRRELATQLTSAMAHDFSNLLTIIMGEQAQLDSIETLDPKAREISDTIKSAAKRGADLVGRLNSVSPQMTLDQTAVKLSAFFQMFEPLARAALPDSVAFDLINDVPDDTLVFDAGFAQDALLNLVINAGEACAATGSVTVFANKTSGGQFELRVEDDGPGFQDDALENAINPFFSTKGQKVGRGLGLTSAYDFAKTSGGRLTYGNRPTAGAHVTFRIPYLVPSLHENGLVLLVDDDDAVRGTVRTYLRKQGHDVIEAASADEAAQLMAVDGLSLIVTDLDIGGTGTGLDVAAASPPDVPLLVITGLPETDPLRKEAASKHMVLAKPFDQDALKRTLESITK